MKNIFQKATLALMGCATIALTGCADFEDINKNPFAVDALATKPYYALNNSIIHSQQNPDTAERLFIINWAAAARQDAEYGSSITRGGYSDDYNSASYNHMTTAIKLTYDAIQLCDEQLASGQLGEHESQFIPNVRAFSRIWRAYLFSEFADSFGPMPIEGFQGVNPEFASLQEVYYYLYDELAEAIAAIDTNVMPTTDESKADLAYEYDPVKWKKYGISLWMRLAMRLSEADNAKAKAEFEKAVAAGPGITAVNETFKVKERPGWDALTGVMTRSWNWQETTATMANLTTNLGGATVDKIIPAAGHIYSDPDYSRYESYVKDASTYLGKKFDRHWLDNTDNPTQQIFFDGLPKNIDPRIFLYFFLPGDFGNRINRSYDYGFDKVIVDGQIKTNYQVEAMYNEDGSEIANTKTDATYAWNGMTAGYGGDQKATYNGLMYSKNYHDADYGGTYPALSAEYRDSNNSRVFFGPWETYFLLAEAAVRGWNTGTSAQAAYENGIKASFDYNGFSNLFSSYINSENYNRVGTSVKFSHTTEPAPVQMTVKDGYTGTESQVTYNYPNAGNILYKGKKLNDQLTKIITQKYIANAPWLPLENWSDHRRLGLPFWEIPTSTTTLPYMPEWTQTSYQGAQKPGYFIQRMKYPSSLNNADPAGYQQAVGLLGGSETTVTPLWWAIGGH